MGKIRPWKSAQKARCSATRTTTPACYTVHTRRSPLICRSTSNIAVGKIRTSWDQKLQERAERASVLAAQAKLDEEIRTQKRVRSARPCESANGDAACTAPGLSLSTLLGHVVGGA